MQILATTDFTEGGNNAVAYAAHLSAVAGGKLYLAHAYKAQSSAATVFKGLNEVLENDAREGLEGLKTALLAQFPQLVIELKLAYGYAADVITRMSLELQIDLVVSGSRGKSLLDGLFFGSTSRELSNNIKKPLLLVPPQNQFEKGGVLLFATALRDLPDSTQLELIRNFSKWHAADTRLLHIFDDDNQVTAEQEIRFRTLITSLHIAQTDHQLQYHEDVIAGILDACEQLKPTALVIQKYHYNFIEKLFIPSMSRALLQRAKQPLLLLPNYSS
ncbi:MAG: universal stress protein [Bacteroidia bacterium]